MSIIYDYYHIFYYVAKYHSFTQAATVLMSNQPNITRTMKKLEQELNCRLFLRSNRGVTLTPEGERLFAHVQIMEEQIQAAEYELASGSRLDSGSVSLGTTEIALHCLLLPILQKFRTRYPNVRIRLTNHNTNQAIAAVNSGMVDFSLVSTPAPGIFAPLTATDLIDFQDIPVAGNAFREWGGRALSLADLPSFPLVNFSRDTGTFEFYNRLFADHGIRFEPDIEIATIDQALSVVKNNLAIGFIPMQMARESLQSGDIFQVQLREAIPPRKICIVRDRHRPFSQTARELLHMIQEKKDEETNQMN